MPLKTLWLSENQWKLEIEEWCTMQAWQAASVDLCRVKDDFVRTEQMWFGFEETHLEEVHWNIYIYTPKLIKANT